MTQEDIPNIQTASKYSIVIIMTKKTLSGRAEGSTEANSFTEI